MFLSCHVRFSEWIYSLYLPECQGTPCSKQARYLKFKVSLAKWLSVRLPTKSLWVRVPLQSPIVWGSFKRSVLANYLNFARRSQLLLNLLFIWSSRFTIFIFCQLILKLRCFVIALVFGRKRTISVLLAFNEILFALNHWTIWERSWLIYLFIFLSDLCENNML